MSAPSSPPESELEQTLDALRDALRTLRYGTVTVVVHDGAVVQIDRTEKLRVPRSGSRDQQR